MRMIAPFALTLLSQAAAACPMGGGPGMGPGSHAGGMAGGVLMGAVAVLGWWLLTKADKEAARAVKWSGRAIAWVLMLGGLSGFLCASLSHAGRAWKACSSCSMHGSAGGGGGSLPPGHPPLNEQPRP